MELPLTDNPTNPEQHVSITVIDEALKQADTANKQLLNAIEQAQKQLTQLQANLYATQGQTAILNNIRGKIVEVETANKAVKPT